MSPDKRKMLLKVFIESQFRCCPLFWMFHSRTDNHKINRLHEKALTIAYSDFLRLSLMNFWGKEGSFSTPHRNIQTEILYFLTGLFPSIMDEVFEVKPSAPYSLRYKNELFCRNPKTVTYGTESISFLAPKI